MINQIASDNENTNLSFIVSKGDLGCVDKAMYEIKSELNHVEVYQKSDISTISVVCKNISCW